jgi:SNF2 family DNA or RNA helicase
MDRPYTLKDFFLEAKMSAEQIPDWFGSVSIVHPDVEDFRPRFHQVTGLNLLFLYTRSALYDEQGTGKTLPVQAALIWHCEQGNKPIVLMPPILIDQFMESFKETFAGLPDSIQIEAYRGSPSQRNAMLERYANGERPPILLMTPEIFRKEFAAFKKMDFCVLACDECKYWSNPDTKIYTAIEDFIGPVDQKVLIGMNGTPAKNSLVDLYGYVRLLTPGVYRSRIHFYSKHVIEKKVPVRYRKGGQLVEQDIKIIDSFRNVEELRKNAFLHARRVEKKDVIEIPEKHIIEFPFRLHPKHAKAYEEFCLARFMEFPDGTAISGEQTATMRQIAAQSVVDTSILHIDEDSAVLDALEELLDELDVGKNKVSIAGYYNRTIELIADRFKDLKPAVIYGPNSSRNSKEADRFKHDKDCRINVLNYQSGGVGLNFQGVCHYGIAAEPTTVPGDFDQWTDRMHRSGQKFKTSIYVLSPKNTIWIKMGQSMLKKKTWNKQVVSSDELKKELLGG